MLALTRFLLLCAVLLSLPSTFALATPTDGTNCGPVSEGELANHCYVTGEQPFNTPYAHGIGGLFTEPRQLSFPSDNLQSGYSIGQLALISEQPVLRKAIEFGWIVSPSTYPTTEPLKPHLFITLRFTSTVPYTSKGACFIMGDAAVLGSKMKPCPKGLYVQLSQNKKPGSIVGETGQPMMYHVGYYAGNACGGEKGWWIQYGNEWLGCVKESWWGLGGFAKTNVIRWFGEVVYEANSCIPMGNGLYGTVPDSASVSNMFYETMQGNQSIAVDAEATINATDARFWSYGNPSWSSMIKNPKGVNGFHYGGPGPCAM